MARMCWRSSLRAYLALGSASSAGPRQCNSYIGTVSFEPGVFKEREQGREGRALVGCWEGVPMLSPAKVQVAAGNLYPANPELRISTVSVLRICHDSPSAICFSLITGSESGKYVCPKYPWLVLMRIYRKSRSLEID